MWKKVCCHSGSSRETQITAVGWDLAQHTASLFHTILYPKRKKRYLDMMTKHQALKLLQSQGQAKHGIPYRAPVSGKPKETTDCSWLHGEQRLVGPANFETHIQLKPHGDCPSPTNNFTYCRRRQSSGGAHKKYAEINSLGHCCLRQRQTHAQFCFSWRTWVHFVGDVGGGRIQKSSVWLKVIWS